MMGLMSGYSQALCETRAVTVTHHDPNVADQLSLHAWQSPFPPDFLALDPKFTHYTTLA